jgi:hypothetical protein
LVGEAQRDELVGLEAHAGGLASVHEAVDHVDAVLLLGDGEQGEGVDVARDGFERDVEGEGEVAARGWTLSQVV